MPSKEEFESLLRRVAVLEQTCSALQQWRKGLVAAYALLVGALLVGKTVASGQADQGRGASPARIQAEEFVLLDHEGQRRASLSARLEAIGVEAAGQHRKGLVGYTPRLTLFDSNQRERLALMLDADGTPSLILSDREAKEAVRLAVDSGPSLDLFAGDADLVSLWAAPDGSAGLRLRGPQVGDASRGATLKTGRPSDPPKGAAKWR